MPFSRLLRIFKKQTRTEKRERLVEDVQCTVSSPSKNEKARALVSDISRNGINFFVSGTSYGVDEFLEFQLARTESQAYTCTGRVLSQSVSYLPNSKDIQKAYFRYSVKFTHPLPEEQWNALRLS